MLEFYRTVVNSPLLWAAAGFVAVLLVLRSMPTSPDDKPQGKFWAERLNERLGLAVPPPVTVLLALIWLTIFATLLFGIFWGMLQVVLHIASVTPDMGVDLRWYLLTLGALATALGGAIALPFTLLRNKHTQAQVRTADEGLITDRINAAVSALGTEKIVNRIGRPVTVTAADGTKTTRIEWQGHEAEPDDGETFEPGDWQVFAESLPNLEVRVGAILALERIAQKTDDVHVQVMETLCAYIRQNAPARDADAPPPLNLPEIADGGDIHKAWEDWRDDYGERLAPFTASRTPRIDIQTALNVLGRRTAHQRTLEARWQTGPDAAFPFDAPFPEPPKEAETGAQWEAYRERCEAERQTYSAYKGYRLDLRDTDLQGCDLSGKCWQGADLRGAQMQGADLRGAQMQRADLRQAQMQGADLSAAQMQGADLWRAQMQGADLWEAQMQGADLRWAQMQGAVLRQAQMQGAVLWWAQMQGADLSAAQMQGADLRWAQMQGADLLLAQMQGADLWEAQMQGADLQGAQMQGADLWEADFDAGTNLTDAVVKYAAVKSVDLRTVTLSQDQVMSLFGDGSVELPQAYLDEHGWPPHWPEEDLDNEEFDKRWHAWQAEQPGAPR